MRPSSKTITYYNLDEIIGYYDDINQTNVGSGVKSFFTRNWEGERSAYEELDRYRVEDAQDARNYNSWVKERTEAAMVIAWIYREFAVNDKVILYVYY